ncbi:MAG: DUF4870 domain-containing protein [Myxococcaceae bacterium]|nr:DUF4870 domain-containing protein [Myxococcaceae bacterium]
MTDAPATPLLADAAPTPSTEERNLAMLAHLSGLFAPFLVPVLLLAIKGKDSPYVRAQTVEALNFHLTLFLGYLLSFPLFFVVIGFFTALALAGAGVVLAIVATVKVNDGTPYRYPFAIRLID